MNYVLKVRIDYLYINNEQYKINILILEGEKRKNKGVIVIRLIAIILRFLFKIQELPYMIYMTFYKVKYWIIVRSNRILYHLQMQKGPN